MEAAGYDSEFLAELLLLAQTYAALNPPIAESGGASFLDSAWSAANQNSYSDSGLQLQEFLEGVARPGHAVRFTRSILETVQQADIPVGLKRDRRFLHELIMLAQGYAVINTATNSSQLPGDSPQSFLHTLWNAQNDNALEQAAGELKALIDEVENPSEVISYVRRLIKAANHTPELEAVQRDPDFLSELMNPGKTYAAINLAYSPNGEPVDFFLHTILTAQSEADIQKGIVHLNQAVEQTKATVSPTQFIEFVNNLITIADRTSDNLGQTQSAAFFAALTDLGQTYLSLQPQTSRDDAGATQLLSGYAAERSTEPSNPEVRRGFIGNSPSTGAGGGHPGIW